MASETATATSKLEALANSQHGGENVAASGARNEKASSEDGEAAPEKQPPVLTRKQKLKQHFRRFWWVHVLIALVLLVILLPILFKVIIPAIVQDIVSKQELPVNAGALQDLSPTQLSMTLNTSLNTPLGVNVEPLQLGLHDGKGNSDGDPYVTLNIPEQHVHHTTPVLIPNQTATITNMTELIDWFNEFFDNPTAKLSVKGKPSVVLSGLHYNANLEKTVEVPGLNYLNGFGLVDMQFMLPPDEKGNNMKGHLNIPNSGVLTLGLGNLTFNMMSGDINLGIAKLYDLTLKPGNNTPYFEGVFYFNHLVPNIGAVLESQSEALGEGNLQFNITGNSTIVGGQHIPYIEGVLNIKHVPLKIPVFTVLGDLLSGIMNGNGGSQSNLLDIVGDVAGNSTLFEDLLHNWDEKNVTSKPPTAKTTKRDRSWNYNLLRLGLRMGLKRGGRWI